MHFSTLSDLDDYRDCLKEGVLTLKAQIGKPYNFAQMADYCGVQRAYISSAFKKSCHLNPDQIYLACEFMKFTPHQTEYVMQLAELNKSTSLKRRQELEERLEALRSELTKVKKSLSGNLPRQTIDWFVLDPTAQLIRIFLTLPKYQENPGLIATALGIDAELLHEKLNKLEQSQLIQENGVGYRATSYQSHLDRDDDLFSAFLKARMTKHIELFDGLHRSQQRHIDFSVYFTADKASQKKIRTALLKAISSAQDFAGDAKEEDVYTLSIAFAKLS